jgi:hypothetical protein
MVWYSNGIWIPEKLVQFLNGQLTLPMYCGLKTGPVFEWLKTRWGILPFEIQDTNCVHKMTIWIPDCPVFRKWLFWFFCQGTCNMSQSKRKGHNNAMVVHGVSMDNSIRGLHSHAGSGANTDWAVGLTESKDQNEFNTIHFRDHNKKLCTSPLLKVSMVSGFQVEKRC